MNRSYKKSSALIRPHHYVMYILAIFAVTTSIFLYYSHQTLALFPTTVSAAALPADIVKTQDWSHFAGATQDGSGVHIKPLGRAIVNQDGSGGQPNPPVNVRGPRLDVSGNFQITATIEGVNTKAASLQFYGEMPIIYDEWRHEGHSVRITITNSAVTVSLWNGRKEGPVKQQTFSGTFNDSTNLTLEHRNKQLIVFVNNNQLGSFSDQSIFRSGHVWFGADAEAGSTGWSLTSLYANANKGGKLNLQPAPSLVQTHNDPKALRNLSDQSNRKLPIGAAIALNPLMTDASYRNLVAGQFNMLTTENEMKAQFIHPGLNIYSFEDADTLVDFAHANNMSVHGHALVFGEANPQWMQGTPLNQRQQVMTDHINTIVSHYKGKVAEWDVVNEPLADNAENDTTSPDIRQTIWYQAMGEQYIDIAFKTARTADPGAKLYLNDFGLEANGDRWDSMLELIHRLKSRGVPFDGVGFQAHVYEDGDHIDPAVLRSHIEELAKLGLSSRISEIDVTGVNAQTQASEYSGVLGACLAEPTCTSFTTWGVTDKYGSTTEPHSYPPDYGDDLLWNSNFRPKAAYNAVQKLIGSN